MHSDGGRRRGAARDRDPSNRARYPARETGKIPPGVLLRITRIGQKTHRYSRHGSPNGTRRLLPASRNALPLGSKPETTHETLITKIAGFYGFRNFLIRRWVLIASSVCSSGGYLRGRARAGRYVRFAAKHPLYGKNSTRDACGAGAVSAATLGSHAIGVWSRS